MLSSVAAFTYKVRERKTDGGSRSVGTYAHAAGQDPPLEGATIVVKGEMWRVVATPQGDGRTTGPSILFVEPFADAGSNSED
jgi:hypothetical protein